MSPPTARRRHPGSGPGLVAAALSALLAGLLGCSTDDPTGRNTVTTSDPRAVLLARPSFEDTVARYQQMQHRIRNELDGLLGRRAWADVGTGSPGNCIGAFGTQYDGKVLALPQVGFVGSVPDDRWPRAEQIVTTIVREYGFDTTGQLRIDRPGRHEISARDPVLDAFFDFGTENNTSMQTTTGCHLPAAARPPA